jgi:hypothetical protein
MGQLNDFFLPDTGMQTSMWSMSLTPVKTGVQKVL